jgi:hypothetical protein
MKKNLYGLSLLLIFILLCSACKRDFRDVLIDPFGNSSPRATKASNGILELAYELTTFVDYKADFEKLSTLDLAHLNPKADKERIEMTLLANGEIRMTTERLTLENPINLPHLTIPSDIPEITRTEVFGSRISFYDATGKLAGTEEFKMPQQTQLVEDLKKMKLHSSEEEIAQAIANLQGQVFVKNLELFLAEAERQGAFIQWHEHLVTVRQDLTKMGIKNQLGSGVTLLDTKTGKMLGYVIYDEKENVLQRTYYRYNTGEVKSIKMIQTEEVMQLPSGTEVSKVTLMTFDNLVYKLNIHNIH